MVSLNLTRQKSCNIKSCGIYFKYKAFKSKRFSKNYTFKKIKDFIDYDNLAISAYKQAFKIHIPSLLVFLEKVTKNICVLNLQKFIIIKDGKVKDKKLKIFENEHLQFLSKHFAKNGKEKLFLNNSSFLTTWKMSKWLLYLQSKFNDFLQTYLIIVITHLLLMFVNEDFFFQEYIEMKLKIFFKIPEQFF